VKVWFQNRRMKWKRARGIPYAKFDKSKSSNGKQSFYPDGQNNEHDDYENEDDFSDDDDDDDEDEIDEEDDNQCNNTSQMSNFHHNGEENLKFKQEIK
jgi:hypothetical protein